MDFPKDELVAAPAPQRGKDAEVAQEKLSIPEQPEVAPVLAVAAEPGDEIKALRTATSKTFATENANELRVVQYQQPIHFKNANKNWQQIDERLVVDGDNEAHPRAAGRQVEVGDDAAEPVLGSVDLALADQFRSDFAAARRHRLARSPAAPQPSPMQWEPTSTVVPTYDANGATVGLTSTTSETTTISATRYLDGLVRTWKQSAGSASLDENKYEYDGSRNQTLRAEFGTSTGTDWKKLSDTTTAFSDAGLPRTVNNSRLPAATSYRYDEVGNLIGSDMPNGQSDYLKRDPGDDMLEKYIVASVPGAGDDGQAEGAAGTNVITKNTFEYDNNYRLTRNTLAVPTGSNGSTGGTQEYDYDAAGRLDTFISNDANKSLDWDLNGNRRSVSILT